MWAERQQEGEAYAHASIIAERLKKLRQQNKLGKVGQATASQQDTGRLAHMAEAAAHAAAPVPCQHCKPGRKAPQREG